MDDTLKLSKNKKAVVIAYNKGYRVINGEVISLSGYKRKLFYSSKKYPYYVFTIKHGSKYLHVPVHQLVAFQKYGKKLFEDNITVRHLDGNSLNNCEENIDLGNLSENIMDIAPEERLSRSKHAASFIRKYSDDKIQEIKNFHRIDKSYKLTMEKFNISSKGQLHYLLNKNKYLKYN